MTSDDRTLDTRLAAIDRRLCVLEASVRHGEPPLEQVLEPAIEVLAGTMRAYIEGEGRKPVPPADADVLVVWQSLVKGDPTWNAIRDNCRELVFYRNCLSVERRDALPRSVSRMAVRTARHVYLYVRTRAAREGLVARA